MSNSEDPDETAHYEPSHLDLCCLQKPIMIVCGSERVKLGFLARNFALSSVAAPKYKYICSGIVYDIPLPLQ